MSNNQFRLFQAFSVEFDILQFRNKKKMLFALFFGHKKEMKDDFEVC